MWSSRVSSCTVATSIWAAAAWLTLLAPPPVLAQEQCNGLTGPAQDACDMQAAFGGSTVVPDVIPVFNPQGALYLAYGTVTVGGAQQLSPSRTLTAPTVSFSPVNSSASGAASGPFVLLMVDADSAKPDTLQWLVQDVTVNSDGILSTSSSANAPAPYLPPQPDSTATSERIVALLYTQPNQFKLPSSSPTQFPNTATGSRVGFDLQAFVQDANLGDPIAGSFFKSTNDGSVKGPVTAVDATPASTPTGDAGSSSDSSSLSSKSHSSSSSSTNSLSSSTSSAPESQGSTSGAHVLYPHMMCWSLCMVLLTTVLSL